MILFTITDRTPEDCRQRGLSQGRLHSGAAAIHGKSAITKKGVSVMLAIKGIDCCP